MPTLTLPSGPVYLEGGDLPVTTDADVLAILPAFLKPSDPAPVRDALIAALTQILIRWQELSAYAASQCDVGRATDEYLESLGDDRQVFKQTGEGNEALRARILATPDLVTPAAIIAAANAVLAPLTNVQAQYLESALDRMFIFDGSQPADLHSFVGAAPKYLDRLYPDDDATNGAHRPNSDPGTNWIFADEIGRYFVLRVPVIGDADVSLVYDGTKLAASDQAVPELGGGDVPFTGTLQAGQLPPSSGGRGLFVADGSNTGGSEADGSCATFLFDGVLDPLTIYQSIANAVERIKGHSIRWMLFVDPALTS